MPKINLLAEDLINKIAAGEVIERPASVVKELIENSLDAEATRISIDIKDSGKAMIKVSDNGEGMDEADARNSILRYSTSKIRNDDDLFSIMTLGFRGEALASIAAVSQMSITTKREQQTEGFNIAVEAGQVISSGAIAAGRGTMVEVRNIFFNTPARKKFLKTDPVELRHIVDVVISYALINNKISFRLVHDGHELLNSPAVEDLRDNISSIYGVSLAKDLMKVEFESNDIKVKGYIAKPHQARNDKSQQAVFINNRWVKSEEIARAVYDAYHSLLFINKHPILVLNIDIDPQKIDVNVHPTKAEIKIEQKDEVYKTVFEAVKYALQKNNLVPVAEEKEEQLTFRKTGEKEVRREAKPKYSLELGQQVTFRVREDDSRLEMIDSQTEREDSRESTEVGYLHKVFQKQGEEEYATPEEEVTIPEQGVRFPAMKLLGQVHRTFFIAETLGGLHYIDQHAAHERVLYERFMNQYMNRGIEVQRLLEGGLLEFSAAEKIIIEENKEELARLGFTMEDFGGNTYLIKTIPLLFGKVQPKEIIYEVIALLKEGKRKLAETKEAIVIRMACRAAVMAGEELTIQRMEQILKELAKTKLPYTCPHGRPTIVKVTVDELERIFKRK